MQIRPRIDADLDACEALAVTVAEDGYPPKLPLFLESPDRLAAWVAEVEANIVGHVVLNPRTSDEVMALASQVLGINEDAIGVIARLFVGRSARRRGVGGALLQTATAAAVARGLTPVLDVATFFHPAVALYEKHGWVRIGEVQVPLPNRDLDEFVYVGPSAAPGLNLR